MAKADEIGSRETQKDVSMQVRNFPKDLLQRFMNENHFAQEQSEETEEIELSLGLSLNGRFGVDPTRANNKLTRSSSIPDFINSFVGDQNDTSFEVPMGCANLIRTCSLPTEIEEEWRKRKEIQIVRRMEAKRKRSEKQMNLKIARDKSRVSGEEINGGEDDMREEGVNGIRQMENCGAFGVHSWANVGTKGACGIVLKGSAAVEGGLLPPTSQGSNGSPLGGGSSGISELESQPHQGSNKCTDAVSPSCTQSMLKNEQKPPRNPEVADTEKPSKSIAMEKHYNKTTAAETRVKEVVSNLLEDMPCVSTTGDGPDGKRIEGFLYRYRKGEEVRIVCVCHGSFLSPAEFVKHAGGGDVVHPLKHIVVNPYPIL